MTRDRGGSGQRRHFCILMKVGRNLPITFNLPMRDFPISLVVELFVSFDRYLGRICQPSVSPTQSPLLRHERKEKSRITVNFYFAKLCLPFSIRSEGHCRKCEVKDEEEVHTRACGHSQVWQCYDLVVANFRSVLSKNELDETPKHFQTWELCRLSAVLDS